jgi:hypothetical protein
MAARESFKPFRESFAVHSNNNKNERNTMARINIPSNPDAVIELAKHITLKHDADGAGSPLMALDMADFAVKTDTADEQNQLAAKLYRDAEKATQDRDVALGKGKGTPKTLRLYVTQVRDLLQGIHKGNEKKLGDWGFEVDDSPAPAKKKAAKPS